MLTTAVLSHEETSSELFSFLSKLSLFLHHMHFDYFLLANSISSQVVFIITQLYCVFGKPWLFSSVVDCPLVPLPNFFKIKIQVSGFVKLMFYVCCLLANCWLLSAYTFLKTNFLTNHLTNCEQTPLIDLYFSKSPWTKAAPSGKTWDLNERQKQIW